MKILITGASGLVGSKLKKLLEQRGDEVFSVSRSEPKDATDIQWDAYEGFSKEEAAKLEGMDVAIHLAGENIAGGSWTAERKRRIKESRTKGTKTLVDALKACDQSPKVFIGASAIGFYGDRGDEIVTEESNAGEGFLPEICVEWEKESARAAAFAERVFVPRIGIVLSKDGGALEKMLTPFQYGVGGVVGTGEQWMPWIAIDDLVSILMNAIDSDEYEGIFNATAPNPVKNKEFTEVLADVVNRWAVIPVPGFGVKLLFGEMGEKLLLEGARVIPRKLEQIGFKFQFPKLKEALEHVIQEN